MSGVSVENSILTEISAKLEKAALLMHSLVLE